MRSGTGNCILHLSTEVLWESLTPDTVLPGYCSAPTSAEGCKSLTKKKDNAQISGGEAARF